MKPYPQRVCFSNGTALIIHQLHRRQIRQTLLRSLLFIIIYNPSQILHEWQSNAVIIVLVRIGDPGVIAIDGRAQHELDAGSRVGEVTDISQESVRITFLAKDTDPVSWQWSLIPLSSIKKEFPVRIRKFSRVIGRISRLPRKFGQILKQETIILRPEVKILFVRHRARKDDTPKDLMKICQGNAVLL